MQPDVYQFTRVTMTHYSTIKLWLTTPAVQKWWGDPIEQADILREDIKDSRMAMSMNMVSINNNYFAYIQDYEVHAWPQKHLNELPSGTRAIDTFIGLESHLGLGHGSRYIRQRAQQLLDNGATGIVIDPEVINTRAIRAYEKAGFQEISIKQTSNGPVTLMQYQSSEHNSTGIVNKKV